MSEYQYYEFQAIDRPLTESETAELRALTSRATITPTRLQNVYHWGNFRGDPEDLMERYFDAFVYVANWGTNWCMLRLPRRVLDPETAELYCAGECASVDVKGENVILDFRSEDEGGGGWVEDEDAAAWMPSLVQLRADLASGDLRALYLAWLACLSSLEDGDLEPPVPPGLRKLSAPHEAFSEFLRVDEDLLAVAAERSADLRTDDLASDLDRWVRGLSASETTELLLRLVRGDEPNLRGELLRRFREANPPAWAIREGGRTVADLLALTSRRTEAREREEAERKAAEQARLERERAAARAVYLDDLSKREEWAWREVEALIQTKQPKKYDQAVQLLVDLRDLAERNGTTGQFLERLREIRAQHVGKYSFVERLDRTGLTDRRDAR